MSNMKIFLATAFVIIVRGAVTTCLAATGAADGDIDRVEQGLLPAVIIAGEPAFQLQERMAHYKVPGVSVTVFKDFRILWSRQYGLADAELGSPVTAITRFNVGSLSKGVASLLVLSLVDDGLIQLDGDVNGQLKSWSIPENEFTRDASVTPRLLMNHSGGAIFSPAVSYPPGRSPTLMQVLNGEPPANTSAVIIDRVPGTQFQYSNAGYAILQQLAMDVAGESFETLARQRIFQPLGMNHSSFELALSGNLSAGHQADGNPVDIKRYVYPIQAAGGLWSTTEDYARFLIEIQKSYNGESDEIITRELAQEMLSPHAARQYGLGVFMREMDGEIHYFGHLGDNKGFFAGYLAHRSDGYGAVVFTNSQAGVQLIREIVQSVAAVYEWENYLPEAHVPIPVSEETLRAYAGTYQLGSDASFTVVLEGGQLVLDQFGGVKLFHVGEGEFVNKFRKGSLRFGEIAGGSSSTAIFHFSDELGRFMEDPVTCDRIEPDKKLPFQLLEAGRYEDALDAYRELRRANPDDRSVSESRFNQMGYTYLGQGKPDLALSAFRINVELYPDSWNCYDSIGDAYMRNGDKDLAIINFKRSVEMNPNNQHGIRMLEQLEGGR